MTEKVFRIFQIADKWAIVTGPEPFEGVSDENASTGTSRVWYEGTYRREMWTGFENGSAAIAWIKKNHGLASSLLTLWFSAEPDPKFGDVIFTVHAESSLRDIIVAELLRTDVAKLFYESKPSAVDPGVTPVLGQVARLADRLGAAFVEHGLVDANGTMKKEKGQMNRNTPAVCPSDVIAGEINAALGGLFVWPGGRPHETQAKPGTTTVFLLGDNRLGQGKNFDGHDLIGRVFLPIARKNGVELVVRFDVDTARFKLTVTKHGGSIQCTAMWPQ